MCHFIWFSIGDVTLMKHLIGIDIGTSGVKTIVVNENGDLISQAFEETRLYTPRPNWVEQDPQDWWLAVIKTVRKALANGGMSVDSIVGLGLSGQMHSSVFLEQQSNVVGSQRWWVKMI